MTWEVPTHDGGNKITGYFVEKCAGYSSRWIKINKEQMNSLSLSVSDLVEDSEYDFRVIAVNEAGQSKPSESTGLIKAKDPYNAPGEPENLKIEDFTPNSVNLKWAAPENDGGSKVQEYVVQWRRTGEKRWREVTVKDKEATIKNLEEGEEYEFKVAAKNKVGQGNCSSKICGKYSKFLL